MQSPRSAANQLRWNKVRWGDLEDEEDDRGEQDDYFDHPAADDDDQVVSSEAVNDDDDGCVVKRVISYKLDDEGRKVKVTTTIRIRKLPHQARLCKRAIQRRSWPKFGDAAAGGDRLTTVSTDEIFLDRPRANISGDPLRLSRKGNTVIMVCRTCGKKGDHWTAQCPYKHLAPPPQGSFVDKPSSESNPGSSKGTYVPPSLRPGASDRSGQEMMRRRNDDNSVRVTNLSDDTRETDLHDLFTTFGPVTRVYIAHDKKTGSSRGFGFVNFANKVDAEKAIAKLDGYGYDNLILQVEWATPRTSNI